MARIQLLDDRLINQIAAGEVVERPASVVKELVENSLDAGSTTLQVQLQGGGRRRIEIQDDGQGMPPPDALMCLERHATSKIRRGEDLFRIATLGFRGEAIPSIASVSRFELLTRPRDADIGTRVVVHGGTLRLSEPVGCPPGTRIVVKDLFFNLPARRKFMRTVPTELSHCMEAITRVALIRPDVDWTVHHEGRVSLRAPKAESRLERARALLGDAGRDLFEVDFSRGELRVQGLISPIGISFGRGTGTLYLYINGRFVRDPVLRRAALEAYRHLIPKGRYPVLVLELTLPLDAVDVNVHPSKIEVRFRDARGVIHMVEQGLRQALQDHGARRAGELAVFEHTSPVTPSRPPALSPGVQFSLLDSADPTQSSGPRTEELSEHRPAAAAPSSSWVASLPPPRPPPPAPGETAEAQQPASITPPADSPEGAESVRPQPELTPRSPVSSPGGAVPSPPQEEPLAPPRGADAILPVPRFQDLKVIGQFDATYLVCEALGELILLDQHAAHERVSLHRLLQQGRDPLGVAQPLLTPILVELPAGPGQRLEEQLEVLQDLHLEVEPYGGGTFAIHALPERVAREDLTQLLSDIAEDLSTGTGRETIEELKMLLLNRMACHGSIRAHDVLTPFQMRELLRQLDQVDFEVCAHGRPVALRITRGQLERLFHRV